MVRVDIGVKQDSMELWEQCQYTSLLMVVSFEHIMFGLIGTFILWMFRHRQTRHQPTSRQPEVYMYLQSSGFPILQDSFVSEVISDILEGRDGSEPGTSGVTTLHGQHMKVWKYYKTG